MSSVIREEATTKYFVKLKGRQNESCFTNRKDAITASVVAELEPQLRESNILIHSEILTKIISSWDFFKSTCDREIKNQK